MHFCKEFSVIFLPRGDFFNFLRVKRDCFAQSLPGRRSLELLSVMVKYRRKQLCEIFAKLKSVRLNYAPYTEALDGLEKSFQTKARARNSCVLRLTELAQSETSTVDKFRFGLGHYLSVYRV